jgi:2-oxoglutarate dehydrogenase E2 component (dihydrolipoamide succinyltransferase)
MSVSVEVPSLGESVTEAIIASWTKKPGDYIEADEILVELETDKVSVEIPSPISGVITELKADIDDTVNVGDVIAIIEAAERPAGDATQTATEGDSPERAKAPTAEQGQAAESPSGPSTQHDALSPAVQRLIEEHGLHPKDITATGPSGRLLKGDVLAHVEQGGAKKTQTKAPRPQATPAETGALEERVRMTRLRQTIAKRLVEAQQTAAMLTTFNEVDMTNLMAMRKKYQESFVKKHGTKLGFMSFFTKAVIESLKEYPAVNAEIDGNEIVYKNYYHVGIAIGGGKGLVVPVIRDADQLGFAEIELEIKRLGGLAMDNKLTMGDLQGGTFTITNGGIYGSMLSTPILNPPQSGILGMHNIVQRPVAIDGKVEIRPIMYLALSYDHRIVDGREAVSFLVRIKECIENPERILFEV